jgi:hypothetical protein
LIYDAFPGWVKKWGYSARAFSSISANQLSDSRLTWNGRGVIGEIEALNHFRARANSTTRLVHKYLPTNG